MSTWTPTQADSAATDGDKAEPFNVRAVLQWAELNRKNRMSEKYQVILTELSDAAVARLEGYGVNVNHSEDRGAFITAKSNNPIKAYLEDGTEVEPDKMIGNGSVAIVRLNTYNWNFNGKKGTNASIMKLTITDFKEYAGSDQGSDEVF